MGQADRKLQRALGELERAYAEALRPQRLFLGELRPLVADAATESDAVAQASVIHRDAAGAAWRAADKVGGSMWVARSGLTITEHADRLWTEHGEPLTGITALRLRDALT